MGRTEFGRISSTPWFVEGSITRAFDALFSHDLALGGEIEVNAVMPGWYEFSATGPEVFGAIVDSDGLVAEPEMIVAAFDRTFAQNIALTLHGIQYGLETMTVSTTRIERLDGRLTATLERVRTDLTDGRRTVLDRSGTLFRAGGNLLSFERRLVA
jgi:hypothetical protein